METVTVTVTEMVTHCTVGWGRVDSIKTGASTGEGERDGRKRIFEDGLSSVIHDRKYVPAALGTLTRRTRTKTRTFALY